ncbi:MAG: DUF2065 domain-containing protein [Alphaproteobacteria bacterium]|nr:DUF2065 domain-containing protein [Alphaproteobacteria bacterium]
MSDFVTALGLVLVIEGILYALFPEGMRRMVADLLARPAETLRVGGLLAAALGLTLVWLIRH